MAQTSLSLLHGHADSMTESAQSGQFSENNNCPEKILSDLVMKQVKLLVFIKIL